MGKTNLNNMMKKQQEKADKAEKESNNVMLEKLMPIAKEVLKLVYEADLPLGRIEDMQTEEAIAKFEEVERKVQQMFVEHNIRWVDKDMVFQLAAMPLDKLKSNTINTLYRSYEAIQCRQFGVSAFDDLRFQDLDLAAKETAGKTLRPEPEEGTY